MSESEVSSTRGVPIKPRSVALFVAGVLLLRLLASQVGQMSEGDEISIASGIAAIVRGVPGVTYRYGVQFGYYRLIATLASLLGGDLTRIPIIMSWVSLLAGVVVPACGLFAFRSELTIRERWLVAALLAANPIVWMSARYGNTAMPSVAFTALAITLLSNRPSLRGEIAALFLFGLGITMRADAVLVSGGVLALLWRTHGSLRSAVVRLAIVGGVIAALLLLLRAIDPYMESVVREVASHTENPIKTRFFEFLMWAMSPFPLFFACVGLREAHRERPALFVTLMAWIAPPFAFYFTNTTTPRYVLQGVLPLTLAAAIGMLSFVDGSALRRLASIVCVLSLGFVHLLIALSAFSPGDVKTLLKEGEQPSDDGPVWTGALLYKSYVRRPLHPRRLVQSHIRPQSAAELTFTAIFDTLSSGSRRGARIVIANGGGYANTMHLYANLAGAVPLLWKPGTVYDGEARFQLGGTSFDVVGLSLLRGTAKRIQLGAGDELWVVAKDSAAGMLDLQDHLPERVILESAPRWATAPRLTRYVARERAP